MGKKRVTDYDLTTVEGVREAVALVAEIGGLVRMTDLRAELLSRLDDLLATCDAATMQDPWRAYTNSCHGFVEVGVETIFGPRVATVTGTDNARFIAAHSPFVLRPVWEALRAEVEKHDRAIVPVQSSGRLFCALCGVHANATDGFYVCPAIIGWATALGVTADDASEVTS